MIFEIFTGDQDLLQYIHTDANIRANTRDFLLNILANIRREKYTQLYSKYKEIKAEKTTGGNKIYKAQITNQFFTGLQNFTPINM